MSPLPALRIDNWFDPDLMECQCLRCQRGGRCAAMRDLYQLATERDERRAKLSCLADEDRTWLAQHGWDGS